MIITKSARSIALTAKRRRILELLCNSNSPHVRMATIINDLYGLDPNGGPDDPANSIKVHICYLRRFLADFGVKIETAIGVGYRIPPNMREEARKALEKGGEDMWFDRRLARETTATEVAA